MQRWPLPAAVRSVIRVREEREREVVERREEEGRKGKGKKGKKEERWDRGFGNHPRQREDEAARWWFEKEKGESRGGARG